MQSERRYHCPALARRLGDAGVLGGAVLETSRLELRLVVGRPRDDLCANQPVSRVHFFTKSFLGENAAVLAGTSGNRPYRHVIELASRRWRGGRETRRDNLIDAQATTASGPTPSATRSRSFLI